MKKAFSKLPRHLKSFYNDTNGGVLEYVMVIGVIALPLVLFLSVFGTNVIKWIQENAPNIFDEASTWIGG